MSDRETPTKRTGTQTQNGEHEQRDHLLRSLDDLDREFAAGDIDPNDYATLRADYTTRAAAILRKEITTGPSNILNSSKIAARTENQTDANADLRPKRSATRRIVALVGVLVVAIGSGVAVARFAGERVGSTGMTGTVRQAASPEQQQAEKFMQIGRDNLGSDPIKSLQAFDAALKIDPTIAEAMAYSGWVLRIASLSAEGKDAEDLRAGAIRRINEAIIADPTFPDAYAFKGVIALRDQDDPKTALAAFKKLDGLQTPPFVQQLVDSAREEAEEALANPAPASETTPTESGPTESTPTETTNAK